MHSRDTASIMGPKIVRFWHPFARNVDCSSYGAVSLKVMAARSRLPRAQGPFLHWPRT